jgi:predicted ATPase/GAF domain-containing protein
MFAVRGYETRSQLHEGEQSIILRAVRESDGLPVVLKILKDARPPPERIARFKREHQILQELDLPGVVRVHELLNAGGRWLFVEEDTGGESMARLGLCGRVDVGEILSTACELAGHLAAIHQRGIIHKDINPSNILVDPRSRSVKIIDFGIATRLSREAVAFEHPGRIEGTPAYLSPEQTGRINQPLDQRTDLYSLGCTLYELAAGRPPFEGRDALELIHHHLAHAPEPLHSRRPDVPPVLSAIVGKLLAKNAGDRYQSARGLLSDLAACQREWGENGAISARPLGSRDAVDRLSPPSRLHGRDAEVLDLAAAFERVCRGGIELVVLSGPPGVGKSALARELYRPVTERRGFFAAGKFDQLRGDAPYGPLLVALDELVGQALMDPPSQVAALGRAIAAEASGMLPALLDVLPRLRLLYEELPPHAGLSAAEIRRRFKSALAGVIRVFATADHPLVLFIDDLQWADSPFLELLRHLMTAEPVAHLLVLGACRDDDAQAAHPMRTVLEDIRSAGATARELRVGAFSPAGTLSLVADLLRRSPEDVREPSELIHQKTLGNPFFIQTILTAMVAEGVVFFDAEALLWRWHTDRLRLLDLSDNVVDLLVANLRKLPERTRALLTQAACVGNRFELGVLAAAAEEDQSQVASSLLPALKDGYLLPTSADYRLAEAGSAELFTRLSVAYKFAHDRIQQAAYLLGAKGTHAAIHLRIGRAMRARLDGGEADARLLAAVRQLNLARELIDSPEELREIARMNLVAGRRAKAAVADEAALQLFEEGLASLAESHRRGAGRPGPGTGGAATHDDAFQESYSLALLLTEEAADAAYLGADFATMDRHVDAILRRGERLLDRVKAVQVRMDALIARNELSATLAEARAILEPLGLPLPRSPGEGDLPSLLGEITRQVTGRRPQELAELPEMRDPEALAALRILTSVGPAAFLTEPFLVPVIAAQMVLLSLRHGLAEDSVRGFVLHGMSLCAGGDLAGGNDFGRLAEILVERHQRKSQMPDLASLGYNFIFHWQRPLREGVQKQRDGYRAGIESGAVGPAVNCLQGSSFFGFLAGFDLASIDAEYVESAAVLERYKQGPFLVWLRQFHQAVRNLRGPSREPASLVGDVYDEIAQRPVHEAHRDMTAIFNLHFLGAILSYHFHDYAGSLRHARAIQEQTPPGCAPYPVLVLYRCLALIAVCADASPEERPAILREAAELAAAMERWGESCPANYAHKYHLMTAELRRVSGRPSEARDHYDLAIDLARDSQYLHEEALAMERAALFHLERKNARLAGHYMRDAHYTYGLWGAGAKRDFLQREYGYLLQADTGAGPRVQLLGRERGGEAIAKATTTTGELDVDLATVLAATRAVTRETDLGRLLEAVMRVSLENAGAERGFLILVRGDQLLVKVRGELGDGARFESLSVALGDQEGLARSVVRYVARAAEPVLLADAAERGMFAGDPHVRASGCKSLLCLPILSQGSVVAISYLENNRATGVFNEDRLDLLTLLMGQAAISIENALLKESEEVLDFHFRVGGTVPSDSPTYVRRKADELLAANLAAGELSYVFNSRQMGKSSLRVRAMDRLRKAGVACAAVDITSIGSRGVTAEQWYAGVARTLVNGLGLGRDFDLRRFWRDKAELSPVQRLDVLFDEVLLAQIPGPIAVFIDEVDAVLALDFELDDFFALLRLFHNRRAEDPRYARLSIVLLGVATPGDLIRDSRRTPFNVGRAIPLSGFRFDEARTLLPGLARAGDAEKILRAVLDWSGGQPFLTQKLCGIIAADESRPSAGKEREWVSNLVRARVIDDWRHHDDPEHLKTIEARLLHAPSEAPALLSLYQQILDRGEVDAGDSPLADALVLSGLVTKTFDKLRVGNPIYAMVFDRQWIAAALQRS